MELLAPWYAALAAAAAVPLLLHLLRRRIGTRLDFPAVRYLARAEQEHSARLRLRNWLLMALRVLAVLLVALAAARPVARVGGAGHAPTAVAIVLDNSLSTTAVVDGRPLFAALRDAALGVVANAAAEDRLWLVTANGRVVGGDAAAVRDAIRSAAPLAGAGDVPRAVARAADVARAARLASPTVVVLTDAQATAWRSTADANGVRLVTFAPGGTPPRNRTVVAAAAAPRRWTPTGQVVARVLSADSVPYRISELGGAGERTLVRGTVAPNGEIRVRVSPSARGWVAGSVAVQPDELRGDDQRFFAAFSGEPPAAVADPSAGPFVASALATLSQSGRVTGASLRAASIVSADAATRLPALLVAPADPTRVGPANQALERLGIPWRFAAARTGDAQVRFSSGAGDSARVGVVATRRFQLVPGAAARADTLATAGGEAWVVAGPGYVLVGSPLQQDATTLPVRAGFVPWLAEVLAERLGGDPGVILAAAPGAPVEPPSGADALLGPDGRRIPLAAGMTAPDPGVYLWLRGAARVGALVVNVEPEESDLARMNARTLAERLRGGPVQSTSTAADAASAAFAVHGQRPIGGAALVAALIALAAEGLATRRRRATASSALAAA